jgi:ribosome maturation factor RimP
MSEKISDITANAMASNNSLIQKIEKLASDVCLRENCELYDLEIVGSGEGRIVRVYIDKVDEGNNSTVGIEDCTNVSRGMNLILDVEDVIPGGAYNLEVSSPGLDRRLKKPAHFQKVVGKKIWVQLMQNLGSLGAQKPALSATKKFEDILTAFEENKLHFQLHGELVKIPIQAVEKSKVVFEMKKGTKGPKSPHKKN